MPGIDLTTTSTLIVGILFGGSGFVAYILTYIQIKDTRREQVRSYFRNIVLNADFLSFLGALFDIGAFMAAIEIQSHRTKLDGLLTRLRDVTKKISPVLFFLPVELQTQVSILLKTASEIREALERNDFAAISSSEISDKTFELSRQLKNVLGIEELERVSVQRHRVGTLFTEEIVDNFFGGVIGAVIGIYYAVMILPANGDYSTKLILSLIVVIAVFSPIKWWLSRKRQK